jgi:hypothetical protein
MKYGQPQPQSIATAQRPFPSHSRNRVGPNGRGWYKKHDLNSCLCRDMVQPSDNEAVRCKQADCETEWVSTYHQPRLEVSLADWHCQYHIACIGLELAPWNWVCTACKVGRGRGGKCVHKWWHILPYIEMCLIRQGGGPDNWPCEKNRPLVLFFDPGAPLLLNSCGLST